MTQPGGIYLISMVASTLDMHPQTIRKYERAGFVVPLRVGPLRTYSDEDVARLRLVKHFVDDLGLNLAGVELALSFIGNLLDVRTSLATEADSSDAVAESVKRIDEMLATLGVRVVRQSRVAGANPTDPPSNEWFGTKPGESLEFSPPASGDSRSAEGLPE